jgi:hypothetical protein
VGAPPSDWEGGSWVASPRLGFTMPAGLKRIYGKGHLHSITSSCYRRPPHGLQPMGAKSKFAALCCEVNSLNEPGAKGRLRDRITGNTNQSKLQRKSRRDRELSWWTWPGSNRRPPACKAGALPAELHAHSYNISILGHFGMRRTCDWCAGEQGNPAGCYFQAPSWRRSRSNSPR